MQKAASASAARSPLQRRLALMGHRARRLHPNIKGMLWALSSGVMFVLLNTQLRVLSSQLHPLQVQFLRYLVAIGVMLPLIARSGVAAFIPKRTGGQFTRGAVHTLGLMLWFVALAKIPMAQTTAMSFTQPVFIMLGAYVFFHEAMRWERWAAATMSFAGVLVIAGPNFAGNGGIYSVMMLASSPIFAASYLLTKALTRHERVEVIVLWQAISVSIFSLPMALWFWQSPSALQWLGFLVAGILGVLGHYSLTRAFSATDISASQSVKFLDLVWASAMGWLAFGEIPSHYTLIGGALICVATVWIGLRESRRNGR